MGKWKWLNSFTVSMALTVICLVIYSLDLPLFYLFELKSYDLKVYARGERDVSGQVAIVAIDENSLKKEGRWPWPRTRMADLIDKISESGAAIIGVDFFFPEKDRYVPMEKVKEEALKKDFSKNNAEDVVRWLDTVGNSDQRFADAIANSQRTILGFLVDSSERVKGIRVQQVDEDSLNLLSVYGYPIVQFTDDPDQPAPINDIATMSLSLYDLMVAAQGLGFVSYKPEIDGVVRWVPLIMRYKETHYPSLPLQMLQQATGIPPGVQLNQFGVSRLWLGDVVVPTAETGDLLVNYYGPGETFRHYSATDVLSGKVGAQELEGKLVFLGATALALHDSHVTPFGPSFPGVEVHATVLENILHQDFLMRPPWLTLLDLASILLPGLIFGLASLYFRTFTLSMLLIIGVGGYLIADFYVFTEMGLWINTIYPIFFQIFIYGGILLFRTFYEEKQKRFIQKAFSKYLSPEMVDELIKRPELLQSGGEERFLTIMFTDLMGYTTIAERLGPPKLAKFMNRYLTEMTEFVLEEKGTINQYAGDAIMASFGVPVPQGDHADRAVRAGLKMNKRLVELREDWSKLGAPDVRCRIGVTTGTMFFGNLGSQQVFYYSVMGDPVNLAARLETANKQYSTRFLISEFTVENLTPDRFLMRTVDMIKVKGKTKPVKVYEVYGEIGDKISQETLDYFEWYQEGFEAYTAKNMDMAEKKFEEALTIRPDDLAAKKMIEHIQYFKVEGIPENWDGSIALHSK